MTLTPNTSSTPFSYYFSTWYAPPNFSPPPCHSLENWEEGSEINCITIDPVWEAVQKLFPTKQRSAWDRFVFESQVMSTNFGHGAGRSIWKFFGKKDQEPKTSVPAEINEGTDFSEFWSYEGGGPSQILNSSPAEMKLCERELAASIKALEECPASKAHYYLSLQKGFSIHCIPKLIAPQGSKVILQSRRILLSVTSLPHTTATLLYQILVIENLDQINYLKDNICSTPHNEYVTSWAFIHYMILSALEIIQKTCIESGHMEDMFEIKNLPLRGHKEFDKLFSASANDLAFLEKINVCDHPDAAYWRNFSLRFSKK